MRPAIVLLGVSLALVACGGGEGGNDKTDTGHGYDIVINVDVPDAWDPGTTHDPGIQTDSGPFDPGPLDPGTQQDPGAIDPGTTDNGPMDPGTGQDLMVDDGMEPPDLPGHEDIVTPTDDGTSDTGQLPDDTTVSDPGPQDDGASGDPDTGPDVPDIPPVDTTCQAFYACAGNCATGDAVCIDACLLQASPEGKQEQEALENCLLANNCFGLTDDAFSDCLDAYCLDPYFDCFSGGDLATCIDLNACLSACPDDDGVCSSDCFSTATYEANWDHQHLHDCLTDTCGEIPPETQPLEYEPWIDCANLAIYTNCGSLGVNCVSGGELYDTCADLIDCLAICPDDDQDCVNGCFDGGSFQANSDYEIRRQCLLGQCAICEIENPTPEEDQVCVDCLNVAANGPCATEAEACQATGNNPCGAVWACVYQCDDSTCAQACYGSGTSTAQDHYDTLVDCLEGVCPDMLVTCVDAALLDSCSADYGTCQADTGT